MASKTNYKLYKSSLTPTKIDIGISSYEIKTQDYGKLELGRGIRVFIKKYSSSGEIRKNDTLILKWDFVPENSITFSKIQSLSNGDEVTFIASGNINMSITGELIDIVSKRKSGIILKNNIMTREISIQICVKTGSIN